MPIRKLCLWSAILILISGCAEKKIQERKVGQQALEVSDSAASVAYVSVPDQSEGMKIIEALSRVYSDRPGVVGGFIGSSRCPAFLEGLYFEGDVLVFQVRGDTMQARQILEKEAGSGAFRIEQLTDKTFSEKQLQQLMTVLNRRYDSLPACPLKANMVSWGSTAKDIIVQFIRNTPEARSAFRRLLMDSPAIRFTGPESPVLNNKTGICDTCGVSLRSEFPAYPDTVSTVSFILRNGSDREVGFGEHYSITYEGTDGQWYELPINTFANDLAYCILPGEQFVFTARLYPMVNQNKPGRYRFFFKITIGAGENILMMAEFRLTDSD